jgi:hypothetical protein
MLCLCSERCERCSIRGATCATVVTCTTCGSIIDTQFARHASLRFHLITLLIYHGLSYVCVPSAACSFHAATSRAPRAGVCGRIQPSPPAAITTPQKHFSTFAHSYAPSSQHISRQRCFRRQSMSPNSYPLVPFKISNNSSKFYNIVLNVRTIRRRVFYSTYYTFTNFCPVSQSRCPVRRHSILKLEVAPSRVQPIMPATTEDGCKIC